MESVYTRGLRLAQWRWALFWVLGALSSLSSGQGAKAGAHGSLAPRAVLQGREGAERAEDGDRPGRGWTHRVGLLQRWGAGN